MALRTTESPSPDRRQIDEIVSDFFTYRLSKRGYIWTPQEGQAVSQDNKDVCAAMHELSDDFLDTYREFVERMVHTTLTNPGLTLESAEIAFGKLVDAIVENGICWPRIVVSFSFAVELAYQMEYMSFTENSIDMVLRWMTNYTARNFMPWIRTHNGWSGVIQYANGDRREQENAGWPNLNAFSMAGVALGALAIGAILTNRS